jgi:DNA-directed RNA polymerase specialized sigma24 family protein
VLGTAFTRTLRDAQAGDEAAFARLWGDANPLMVRYLRVIGVDDPYDAACEGWITVVRGLPGFTGDELAWRVWILACTRMRAEESTLRHGWGSVTALPGVVVPGGDALEAEELLEDDVAGDPAHRGVNDTIAALRALPLGQGEILMLRLGGGLPVRSVSDVVGADVATVQRSEVRALERVGADAELLSWSLAAPATAAELADERVATAAFRSIPRPPAWSVPRTRVVALGSALTSSSRPSHRSRGISNAAGRSRTALLGIAVLSASAMSLGGLGAAAYVGALPDPVQKVMHDTIGAPAPAHHGSSAGRTGTAGTSSTTHASGVGPTAASSPAAGLCRAWAADRGNGTPRQSSVAFHDLASAAGGADHVDAYCVGVLATAPGAPTTVPTAVPTAKGPKTTHPVGTGSGTGSPTRSTLPTPVTTSTTETTTTTGTPDPSTTSSTTSTRTPNPNSPTSKGPAPKVTTSSPAKSSPAKTSPPKTSPPKGGKSTPAPTSTSGSLG